MWDRWRKVCWDVGEKWGKNGGVGEGKEKC